MRGVGDTETHLRVSGLEAKLSLQTSRPESTAPSPTRQGARNLAGLHAGPGCYLGMDGVDECYLRGHPSSL